MFAHAGVGSACEIAAKIAIAKKAQKTVSEAPRIFRLDQNAAAGFANDLRKRAMIGLDDGNARGHCFQNEETFGIGIDSRGREHDETFEIGDLLRSVECAVV